MNNFIQDIHELLPRIPEYRIYKVIYAIKGRLAKYDKLGLGKRDGPKYGISERQMPKLINLLIDYGFLVVDGKGNHSKGGHKIRLFKLSKQFKEIIASIKDFVKKKFEYTSPIEWMKSNVSYKEKYGIYKFEYNGDKYIISKRGRFKDKIYDIGENKIINPLLLGEQLN